MIWCREAPNTYLLNERRVENVRLEKISVFYIDKRRSILENCLCCMGDGLLS